MALTPKEARFIDEFPIDLNATQAAIRAGYSARSARDIGYRLLNKEEVAKAIQASIAERSKRTKIDADWVLTRLAEIADADLADLYGENGELKPVKDWPKVWRSGLVAGIETVEERSPVDGGAAIGMLRKVKLADRLKTLELIGKHITVGAFRERVEHGGPNGGPIEHVSMTTDEFKKVALEIASKV